MNLFTNICIVIIAIFIVFFLLYLFMICPELTRRERMKPFFGQMWAHRGLHNMSRRIPENSMLAFTKAIENNYGIELDVHLTADRRLVVFHDDDLQRVCDASGTIERMTYEELQQFHLSGTFEKIPLFTDVLDHVYGRVPLLIEIKMPTKDTLICKYVKEALDSYRGPYLIESFNSLALRWFRNNDPKTLRGQLSCNLVKDKDADSPMWLRFFVQHLLINWYCGPDFIAYGYKDAHNLGLWLNKHLFHTPIAVWTLKTAETLNVAKKTYDMYIFEHKC
ncbi:MAG: glycerophosphodiester phosphodiesterase family protein [Hespellia sp.]|nr:glycerophosphodiester phosphodiesterase family protein [Hespellia sp.]